MPWPAEHHRLSLPSEPGGMMFPRGSCSTLCPCCTHASRTSSPLSQVERCYFRGSCRDSKARGKERKREGTRGEEEEESRGKQTEITWLFAEAATPLLFLRRLLKTGRLRRKERLGSRDSWDPPGGPMECVHI